MNNKIISIVAADVVDSTSLNVDNIYNLKNIINDTFNDIKAFVSPSLWGRIVKGDSIECCIKDVKYSLRIALLLKCKIKAIAGDLVSSAAHKQHGIRFSIGIGSMRIIDPEMDIMDGEAIYIAGRGLECISQSDETSYFLMSSNDLDTINLLQNSIKLIDFIINRLSAKQCSVIYYKLLGMHEKQIGSLISLTQPGVNNRAKNGNWNLISETLNIYENINWERYVY